jgi:hypothetical protein
VKRDVEIINRRLRNQKLAGSTIEKPEDVVAWLAAVQAQDYSGAKWALGQRMNGPSHAVVEGAFNRGAILRTHVMRPTWHFVAPSDIRWLLALTAPRVLAISAYYQRQNELDDKTFASSRAVLERALEGGKHLTRVELAAALNRSGIVASGPRLGHLMMHAELSAVICSGPRRGKQFTYALLEERVPRARVLTRDESLAELTRRYFTSHGPATARDFAWWSGLTVADTKRGLEMIRSSIDTHVVGGLTCYLCADSPPARPVRPSCYLLPNYDEYLIAYKDREFIRSAGTGHDRFPHHLILDGRLAGSWRPSESQGSMHATAAPYKPFNGVDRKKLAAAIERYARFMRA